MSPCLIKVWFDSPYRRLVSELPSEPNMNCDLGVSQSSMALNVSSSLSVSMEIKGQKMGHSRRCQLHPNSGHGASIRLHLAQRKSPDPPGRSATGAAQREHMVFALASPYKIPLGTVHFWLVQFDESEFT